MKIGNYKELSLKDLVDKLNDEKSLLLKLKINHTVSEIDNPMKLRMLRKNIARLTTELNRRQLADKK